MDKNGLLLGLLTGSVLAASYALFGNQKIVKNLRNQTQDWAVKARHVKENLFDDIHSLTESRRHHNRKKFMGGALLGLLLGAGTAALLTPKSGAQLRKNLTQTYGDFANKTNDIIDFISHNSYRRPFKSLSKVLTKARRTR